MAAQAPIKMCCCLSAVLAVTDTHTDPHTDPHTHADPHTHTPHTHTLWGSIVVDSLLSVVSGAADVFLCEALQVSVEPECFPARLKAAHGYYSTWREAVSCTRLSLLLPCSCPHYGLE